MVKTNAAKHPDLERYKIIRERWDKEDNLLLTRTGIFLTTNSILLAASGFQLEKLIFQIGLACFGFILSFLWLTTSWHSAKIIRTLYHLSREDLPYGLDDIYQIRPLLFRPNTVFGKIIPITITVGWLIFLGWKVALLLISVP